ncbi:SulP family inorganic anion transporter [Trinickia diaoshuihuensis]|uniref:SulP family inorganic anion transporter n=1 Tax=Trinickia diaoshuihuensis TaxID=2292265 RepID=UPI000E279C9E|nr:SulP family inorganic anion transporter [Trinickia diaoshuihuensis]
MAKSPDRERARFDFEHWVPAVSMLRGYRRAWLAKDLFAGLVLTTMLIPVGMSYAEAAGLPVITGLYASIAALTGYAIFGPSRILVLGPDSALAALIAATVLPLSPGGGSQVVALASMLAIMAGAVCTMFGLVRLGFVSDLLSDPIRYGYLNGIGLTLIASQLPSLLGFSGAGETFLDDVLSVTHAVLAGQIHLATAAIGLTCVATILAQRRLAPSLPGIFIVVFVMAALTGWWLRHAYHVVVPVIGAIPSGWTLPRMPSVSWPEIRRLSGGALAIAFVSFADISVLSRVFASRADRNPDRNQELIALGAANLLAGLLQGCPVSSSASRTPVAQAAGAQTQITGIVAAVCIAALLLFAPGLLAHVPHAALAAVVICASIAVMQIRDVARLYRRRRSEFAVSLLCFVGVVLLGVVQGIFMAVGLALLSFVWRAWHPYDAVLGRVAGLRGYHDVTRHPDARQLPGLLLFRWDAPLFFANANIFAEHLREAIARSGRDVRWAIVAAEPITDIDVTAADVLARLHDELRAQGIALCFAEMKGPVKDLLRQYGLFEKFTHTAPFFATVGEAVEHCVASGRHR